MIGRRGLLKALGVSGLALGLPERRVAAEMGLENVYFYLVRDDAHIIHGLGTCLVVDAACRHFVGNGLYLYPDWGSPQVYLVRETAPGILQFSTPEGTPQWQLRARPDQVPFSARVVVSLPSGSIESREIMTTIPRLQVPHLPMRGLA